MFVLDEIDRRLLRALQTDGRITNQDLAKRCHLSATACFDRVKRLRERGFITGYAAQIAAQNEALEKMGRGERPAADIAAETVLGYLK